MVMVMVMRGWAQVLVVSVSVCHPASSNEAPRLLESCEAGNDQVVAAPRWRSCCCFARRHLASRATVTWAQMLLKELVLVLGSVCPRASSSGLRDNYDRTRRGEEEDVVVMVGSVCLPASSAGNQAGPSSSLPPAWRVHPTRNCRGGACAAE